MDDIRDINTRGNLAKYFDSNDSQTNPFGQNQTADRAYRRAERIVGALFLATNHLPASEALRIETRSTATDILRELLLLRDEMRSADSSHADAVRASLRYLVSLLRMLTVSGFVSGPNASVLIEALNELGSFLSSARNSPLAETYAFSRNDFIDVRQSIKDIKDRNILRDTSVKDVAQTSQIHENMSHNSLSIVRKENIIEVLQRGGEQSIVDIAAHMPEYSKKMIQRELQDLVVQGKVRKIGLKRWSRYAFVQPAATSPAPQSRA